MFLKIIQSHLSPFQFGASLPACFTERFILASPDLKNVWWCFSPFVSVQFERDQKVIVFFSSCELVEFHYTLFLETLLSGSGALAPERLPSTSTPLKFLRLHSALDQEVSPGLPGLGACWARGGHG